LITDAAARAAGLATSGLETRQLDLKGKSVAVGVVVDRPNPPA